MPWRIPNAGQKRRAGRLSQDRTRSGSTDPFYKSKRWRKLRDWFRSRPENALCAECRRHGRSRPAVVVDHILPRQTCPERELDSTNLQALCRACDNRKRARDVVAGLAGRNARPTATDDAAPDLLDLTGGDS